MESPVIDYCNCECHQGAVDVADAIGAATACRVCLNKHFPALRDYLYDPPPAPPAPRERIEPTVWNPNEDSPGDRTGSSGQ